jgi:hypothetical protein
MSVDPFHLVVEPPDTSASELPRYANVVHVSSTPYDFRLTFSFLQTPNDGPADTFPPAPTRPVVEVVLPAASIDSLLDLVRAELDRYVDRFGPPRPALQQAAR